jgi:hypothetical protein
MAETVIVQVGCLSCVLYTLSPVSALLTGSEKPYLLLKADFGLGSHSLAGEMMKSSFKDVQIASFLQNSKFIVMNGSSALAMTSGIMGERLLFFWL